MSAFTGWVTSVLNANWKLVPSGGEFALDVVEGGVHFTCTIDTSTGVAKLSSTTETESVVQFVDADSNVVAAPKGETSIGPGSHRLMFVNADDQLHLWVDGSLVEFDAATYLRKDVPTPYFSKTDPGDAEPLGIASKGVALTVERLKVVRDLYYTSTKNKDYITNESGWNARKKFTRFCEHRRRGSKQKPKSISPRERANQPPCLRSRKALPSLKISSCRWVITAQIASTVAFGMATIMCNVTC